jgi:nucleoside-diphosphate-sugar epimerase
VSNPVEVPSEVVVTGAAGWLGQNLVRALAPQRQRVRCLVRDKNEAPFVEIVGPNIEVVAGDVRDPTVLDDLFDGVGPATVFHSAAVIHPARHTREFFDVNVGGTELVLDRARRAGATRFLHVSSNSPFGANATADDRFTEESPYHPYLGYGRSKMEAEQIVQRHFDRGDLATVILRAPWFYGPFQPVRQTRFFRALRRNRFPLVGTGTQRRSMVYTGNLVDGLLLAERVEHAAGRAYWIADSEAYELREILATVRDALVLEGVPVRGKRPEVPWSLAALVAQFDALLQRQGRYVQALHVFGELKDTIACDITEAQRDLGYEPRVALLEGMRASIRSCLERGDEL